MKIPWEEIEQLTQYLKEKGLAELSIETKEGKVTIKKDSGVIVTPPQEASLQSLATGSHKEAKQNHLIEVKSPMVGTFYAFPSPGAEPFVQVGSKVSDGTVLCIIEAMKIMNELTSEVSGVIKEILVKDGQTVEFGQVLMRIE